MLIKPYGDTLDDGAVQLSFTLPIPNSSRVKEVGRQYVLKLGFYKCEITHCQALSGDFTMFVAYGWSKKTIDPDKVKVPKDAVTRIMDMQEANAFIKTHIGRPLVIVGACTGSDAHTVGIDAIMNMKGYDHHFGLERYAMIKAHNLGAQVENTKLIDFAVKVKADAIIISQIVTQKDAYLANMKELTRQLISRKLRQRFILIVGGPHISQQLALKNGFDAGFGKGTYAEHVATFVAIRLAKNKPKKQII